MYACACACVSRYIVSVYEQRNPDIYTKDVKGMLRKSVDVDSHMGLQAHKHKHA